MSTDFILTDTVAEAFFEKHRDEVLINSWRTASNDGLFIGSTCPLGVLLNVEARYDYPGVCSRYWTPDERALKSAGERIEVPMDPILARFIHLTDRAAPLWRDITGQIALATLQQARADIAAGKQPTDWN